MSENKLEDWQQRVVDEHLELKIKFKALNLFFQSKQYKALDGINQNLLQEQWMHMRDYLAVLVRRIQLYNL